MFSTLRFKKSVSLASYPPPPNQQGGFSPVQYPPGPVFSPYGQAPRRRNNTTLIILAVVGIVVCLCIGGIVYFVSQAIQTSQDVVDASVEFFDASLNNEDQTAAEHTCEKYKDSVANESTPRGSYSTSDMESRIDRVTGETAFVRVTGDVFPVNFFGERQENEAIKIDEQFQFILENDQWVMCDEKLANGFWGYFEESQAESSIFE